MEQLLNDNSICWPDGQKFNLGNSLSFRREIQIILEDFPNQSIELHIPFDSSKADHHLYKEILFLGMENLVLTSKKVSDPLWPLRNTMVERWNYGSFKRVHFLSQAKKRSPFIEWPISILNDAKEVRDSYKNKGFKKVCGVHLKWINGNSKESNANIKNWKDFFSLFPGTAFLLIGKDVASAQNIWSRNVFQISQEETPFLTQLVLSSVCDTFMGMASGVSAAAILSKIPYVIFKHPEHDVDEMKIELGKHDFLPFSQKNQGIFRIEDTVQNLKDKYQKLLI